MPHNRAMQHNRAMPQNELITRPPRLLERTIEAALPPSRREDILGDLEERYRSSTGDSLGYLKDVARVLPRLMADRLKGGFSNWSCPLNRLSVVGASADLRIRAAVYQDYIWSRNLRAILATLILMAGVLLGSALDTRWTLPDAGGIALAIGWACGTYQLYFRRGRANCIPPGLSPEQLRSFQRKELRRQMNINWNLHLYWILPAPLFLIAYGAAIAGAEVVASGFIVLAAILLQARITAPKRRRERLEFEKELLRLDGESLEPASLQK